MVSEIKPKEKGSLIDWCKKHIVLSVIIGIFLLFFIIGIFEGGKDNLERNIDEAKYTESLTNSAELKTVYSIGDVIKAGNFKWSVKNFKTAKEIGSEYFSQKADGIYLILDVEVENIGNSAEYLMDSFVKLVDEQGREFSPSTSAAFYLKPQGSALMFDQINPGITKKGKIVYDVPQGLKVADIRISSNLVSSSFYNVKLML